MNDGDGDRGDAGSGPHVYVYRNVLPRSAGPAKAASAEPRDETAAEDAAETAGTHLQAGAEPVALEQASARDAHEDAISCRASASATSAAGAVDDAQQETSAIRPQQQMEEDAPDEAQPTQPPSLSSFIGLFQESQGRTSRGGYNNLGNTCFLNAILQALGCCDPFISRLRLGCVGAAGRQSTPMTNAMMNLYSDGSSCDVRRVRDALVQSNSMFGGWQQHDAHETLRLMLDVMHEETKLPLPGAFDPAGDFAAETAAPATSTEPPSPQQTRDSNPHSVPTGAAARKRPLPAATDGDSATAAAADGDAAAAAGGGGGASGSAQQPRRATTAAPPPPYHSSFVSDTFEGALESRVVCHACGTVSRRLERCFDLSVPLLDLRGAAARSPTSTSAAAARLRPRRPGVLSAARDAALWLGLQPVPLASCLAHFFRAERMAGDDCYHCDACGGKREADRTLSVAAAPEVLCVHVKRFTSGCWSRKLNNRLVFPLEGLDMSPYISRTAPVKTAAGAPAPPPPPPILYDLVSVVAHTGGLTYGHYTAYALSTGAAGAAGARRRQWRHYDDTIVMNVSPREVARSRAYVLFYKRRRAPAEAAPPPLPTPLLRALRWSAAAAPGGSSGGGGAAAAADGAVTGGGSSGGSGGGRDSIGGDEDSRGGSGSGTGVEEPVVYLSRAWMVNLLTAAASGPVNNHALVCRHGGVKPRVAAATTVETQLVAVPLSSFGALVKAYGPHAAPGAAAAARALRRLDPCEVCRGQAEERAERRRADRATVAALTAQRDGDGGGGGAPRRHVIAAAWLARWNAFLKGGGGGGGGEGEDEDFPVPYPGEVDNAELVDEGGGLRADKRAARDYFVTSAAVWEYLVGVYGGGPVVLEPEDRPMIRR